MRPGSSVLKESCFACARPSGGRHNLPRGPRARLYSICGPGSGVRRRGRSTTLRYRGSASNSFRSSSSRRSRLASGRSLRWLTGDGSERRRGWASAWSSRLAGWCCSGRGIGPCCACIR
jgi:hypothetical protein